MGTLGHELPPPPAMASFFTAALKSFQGGKDESPKGDPKDDKAAALPSEAREEFEEYQRQLLEEK